MHFITLLSTVAALITGSNALVIPRTMYVGDFRVFGAQGCHDSNLGVWTIIDDDFKNNECHSGFNGDTVKSLSLTNIISGYTLTVYPGDNCGANTGTVLDIGQCASAVDEWKSFSVHCAYKE